MLFVALATHAAPITGRRAADKAKAFLYKASDMKFAKGPIMMATPDEGIQPYYIFNIGNDGGFVIVSGDDAAYPVLGYSSRGHIDLNNIPDNMKGWLDAYAADLKKIQKMNLPAYNASDTRAEIWEKIPHLLRSEWNQMYPYNLLCPKFEGDYDHRPTGCVATAMAQVMYYHKWPVEKTAPISAYKYRDEPSWGGDGQIKKLEKLEPIVFNWDAMTDKYDYYSSEESNMAVAELMQYAGHSVQMMYSVEASGAYSENIAGALMNKFGYKNTARIVYRDSYATQKEWDELMYNELLENRPILYSGVTKDGAGHQFVCDGYEDGFFHINWGWGGMSDGFFKLEILDPYNQGTGGAGTGMAFSEYQSAVIGVDKPVESDNLSVSDVQAEAGGVATIDVMLNNSRKNYTSMQFDLTLPEGVNISCNDNNASYMVNVVEERSEKKDHNVSVDRLSNGNYRFVLYSPTNSCFTALKGAVLNIELHFDATMNNGNYTAKIDDVLMCNTKLEGSNINGCEFAIKIGDTSSLLGDADDNGVVDDNDVELIINKILDFGNESINETLADIYADGALDIADVVLTSDIILQNIGANRNIVSTDIDENDALSFSPYYNELLLNMNNNTMYKAMQLDITLPSDISFTDEISFTDRVNEFECVLREITKGIYRVLLYSRNAMNISGNEGTIMRFRTDKLAVEAKIHNIVMVTSDLRKVLLKDVDYKMPTGIEDIKTDDIDNLTIYTLEGMRVNTSVDKLNKGIYIINGKKVVIR